MENFDQILDAPPAEQRKLHYAGFWMRVVAYIIDGLILGAVNFVIDLLIGDSPVLASLISLLLGMAYFSIMESSENQATLGKMVLGMKVGNKRGEPITLANALGRYLAKILSALVLCIGFMMVGWDEKKQGLHDKLADTYVFYA